MVVSDHVADAGDHRSAGAAVGELHLTFRRHLTFTELHEYSAHTLRRFSQFDPADGFAYGYWGLVRTPSAPPQMDRAEALGPGNAAERGQLRLR